MKVYNKNIFSNYTNTSLRISKILCLISCVYFLSCKNEVVDYQTNDCKAQPLFIKKIGLNSTNVAFSTSEKRTMGLCAVEIVGNQRKVYQDSSWKKAGWLGPILLDPAGNCFVAPIPVINLLDNPPEKQNIIYKVDAATGKMNSFLALPIVEKKSETNPYGILGFTYLCEANTLYASTVYGSTLQNEKGVLYALDAVNATIIDKLDNVDAMGMGISYFTGKRKLYFGSARNSNVYSIVINDKGNFIGKPILEFSIDGLGPRGDDKAKKIKFNKATGFMQVYGYEFNYNLTAPTEKQENIYDFFWDAEAQKWEFKK